jgi:hypothetical protein
MLRRAGCSPAFAKPTARQAVLESGRAECWSPGALRLVRIAPRDRGVRDAERHQTGGLVWLSWYTNTPRDHLRGHFQGGLSACLNPG